MSYYVIMSRNKLILLIALLALGLYMIPNNGNGLYIKELVRRLGSYILLAMIIWLSISLRFLKKSLNECISSPNNDTASKALKWLKLSFDVKRTMGDENMKNFYNTVNKSKKVDIELKNKLHDILIRKSIKVPLPMEGRN